MRKDRTEEQKRKDRERSLRNYYKNRDELNRKKREKYHNDPVYKEKTLKRTGKRALERYYSNIEVELQKRKEYRKNNKHKVKDSVCRALKARKQACPSWLTSEQRKACQDIYLEAERLTAETGIPHHVDHIYPIKGRLVCGLHVPWNLRAIPAKENILKGNKMPEDFYGKSKAYEFPQKIFSVAP